MALGLIAISYGTALLIHAYGFLAVFAAGLALRRIERLHAEKAAAGPPGNDARAVRPSPSKTAPARMAEAVQGFNEQLERLGEVVVVILVGGMLAHISWMNALWFVPLILLLIRPAIVFVTLWASGLTRLQLGFIGWFGVRGVGSVYYLAYALGRGVDTVVGQVLADLTLSVVAVSVVVHGVSVTPLMNWYERVRRRGGGMPTGRNLENGSGAT
jgi:NhaP-type Na+/H+ or K+/H+ antiporter